MRTNIVIDEKLMRKALQLTGAKTKKSVVEEALCLLIKIKEQIKIRDLRGKLEWNGDLNQMRTDI